MDFKVLGSLSNVMSQGPAGKILGEKQGDPAGDFSSLVQGAMNNVMDKQKTAETLSVAAASGENVPMQDVIQSISEAELTLQTMTTVRDRAVEAYQEITRMAI